MSILKKLVCVAGCGLSLFAVETPTWVNRSNENAQVLLRVLARFAPEAAGRYGVAGLDENIVDLTAGVDERTRAAMKEARQELEKRLATEKDPLVAQDLQILIDAANKQIHGSEVSERLLIPYTNASQLVYNGLKALLDDQVAESRKPASVARLRKYTGLEKGYTPIAELAEQRSRERLARPGLLGPPRLEVENDLKTSSFFVNGIGILLEKNKIKGYEEGFAKLKQQIGAYDDFVRKEILPRSRTDFRLPAELYAVSFENFGIDMPPAELAALARRTFKEVQAEMQTIATEVAKNRKLASSDYRNVIRELKKDQFTVDTILPRYRSRLSEIEAIIRREHLVTLPDRPAKIRLASEAESAAIPAPHMQPPPLINNKGQVGEFVLPTAMPGKAGEMEKFDDFTFDAATWSLTAHEARPGHELQFDAMVERGVSIARALFAFNSTNVEGWGLYSEYIMRPYMPLEARLVSLQELLLRVGRAFLDPELQMGKITPEEARRVLEEDEVQSPAMAKSELERYTFRMPGQAPSYFYGYMRLRQLRADVEKGLGDKKLDVQRYHDFILSQGLLPPAMLRKAVMAEFVPQAN
jgi:hypothetical protein